MVKFFLLFLIVSNLSYSQMSIGIVGGPTYENLRGNQILEDFNLPRVGFNVGISFDKTYESIGFGLDVKYSRKGTKAYFTNSQGLETKIINNYEYIALPIYLFFSFKKIRNLKIGGGTYNGIFIRNYIKTINVLEHQSFENHNDNYKKFDFGIHSFVSYNIPFKNEFNAQIKASNNWGLMNIASGKVINNGTIKTNNFCLEFGILKTIKIKQKRTN